MAVDVPAASVAVQSAVVPAVPAAVASALVALVAAIPDTAQSAPQGPSLGLSTVYFIV